MYKYYKKKIPGLSRLRIWTDGDSSTFKGHPNFGKVAPLQDTASPSHLHIPQDVWRTGPMRLAAPRMEKKMLKALRFCIVSSPLIMHVDRRITPGRTPEFRWKGTSGF